MSKTNPIPIRFDDEADEMISKLADLTGISRVEIIRRAVRFCLEKAKFEGSLDFLLGDRDEIRKYLREEYNRDTPPNSPPDERNYSELMNHLGPAQHLNEDRVHYRNQKKGTDI